MNNYQIGDFTTRLKNACLARRKKVVFSYSKINKAIGNILVREGFLEGIQEEVENEIKSLVGKIAYRKRKPVLTDIVLVSKPSLRIYESAKNVKQRRLSQGIEVFTTNAGLLTGKEAKKQGIGGELLFRIW